MSKMVNVRNVLVVSMLLITAGYLNAASNILYETSFKDGTKGWTKNDQAFLSDVSRSKGAGSLLIKQWNDKEIDSYWLSPAIKNPGKPVKISFWAADNYLKQTDFSYAAVVDVLNYDKAGKERNKSDYLFSLAWDDSRKSSMWGLLRPAGLKWKYYQRIYTPSKAYFKLKFYWHKPIVRGECYLTDIQVKVATPKDIAATKSGKGSQKDMVKSRYTLQISTPVTGNLFYQDDPLRFEILLFTNDNKAIGTLKHPEIRYQITDFEKFNIASGKALFNKAKPVADKSFYKSRLNKNKKYNLFQPLMINPEKAKETGREFFIKAELLSDNKIIASDTVTYGVVNPRKISPKLANKCRFSQDYLQEGIAYSDSKHKAQSISAKSGVVLGHHLGYYWIRRQPKYPGPITFKTKLSPDHPVSYCPNIEQERTYPKNIKQMVPPECVIKDPIHKGKLTFKIDPYVKYIVAYIRHNRDGIASVVPSGLERPIDARTIELQKKAYKAIKKEFPDLPVGFMLYGLPMNPSKDVDIFIKNDMFDYADFIDTHIYASSVDWSEWKRLKNAYKKRGKTPPPLISTEFCKVGGSDQVLHARDTIIAHMDAFANGMYQLYYFNCCNEGKLFEKPFLREPTDVGGTEVSGFMYMQRVNRPRVSEAMTVKNPRLRWSRANWGAQYGGDTLMPVLQALVYYNLVQNFELSDYIATFHPSENTICYVFERGNKTICCLFLTKPVPAETFVLKDDTSYKLQDLFGRTSEISPREGVSMFTVGQNPVTLVFDKKVRLYDPKIKKGEIEKVNSAFTLSAIARGTLNQARLTIPAVFSTPLKSTIKCTVDGTWPKVADKNLIIPAGKKLKINLPISIKLNRTVGTYPLSARLYAGKKLFGLLNTPLKVDDLLQMNISSVPMTKKQNPAISVTITSLSEKALKGRLILKNDFLAKGVANPPIEKSYAVPAKGKITVEFPVPRNRVNLTTSYDVNVALKDDSGIALSKTEEVAFRATQKAKGKITIDGYLDDWHLDRLIGIPMPREFRKVHGKKDLDATFYTLWDKDNLYMAAIVKDDSSVIKYNDISIWSEDNIMFGLYPWGWKKGDPLNSGYYREHLGLCKDGKARIFRVGNVGVGPKTAEHCKIAVRKTKDGYIYEWSYPRKSIAPMKLAENARFRLSLTICDKDYLNKDKKKESVWHGLQFGGFNENTDARPNKWREFILTK